jgi:hypothetical protein
MTAAQDSLQKHHEESVELRRRLTEASAAAASAEAKLRDDLGIAFAHMSLVEAAKEAQKRRVWDKQCERLAVACEGACEAASDLAGLVVTAEREVRESANQIGQAFTQRIVPLAEAKTKEIASLLLPYCNSETLAVSLARATSAVSRLETEALDWKNRGTLAGLVEAVVSLNLD